MKKLLFTSSFLFFVMWVCPALGKPQLTPAEYAQLEKGKILRYSQKVPDSKVMMGKAIAIVPDVPEAVMYVLLDIANYKNFLPSVKTSRTSKRAGWHTYGVVETDLPWPVKDAWVYAKFTRYDKPGRVYEIKWWMINGTMKTYTGYALIEPYDKNATKSYFTYKMLAEPKTSAPDSTISDGIRSITGTIVEHMRLRIKALRKFNKMPKSF